MKNTVTISKRLFMYNYFEYEQWLSEQALSGWKFSKFLTRKKVEFRMKTSKNYRFIILTTNFSRSSFMLDLQYKIRSSCKFTEFEIPKTLVDTLILYRLQIDDDKYTELVKQRNIEMQRVLKTKIGMCCFLMILMILALAINYVPMFALLMLAFLISFIIYYSICYKKYKRLNK